jgi:hypothetical protein
MRTSGRTTEGFHLLFLQKINTAPTNTVTKENTLKIALGRRSRVSSDHVPRARVLEFPQVTCPCLMNRMRLCGRASINFRPMNRRLKYSRERVARGMSSMNGLPARLTVTVERLINHFVYWDEVRDRLPCALVISLERLGVHPLECVKKKISGGSKMDALTMRIKAGKVPCMREHDGVAVQLPRGGDGARC